MNSPVEIIEETAADWIARESRGLDHTEATAFNNWLEAAIAHRVAYLRLKAVWDRTACLAQESTAAPARAISIQRYWPLAAAVAFLAIVLSLYLVLQPGPKNEYVTAIGDRKTVHLADGSLMELNTNTRVHTVVTKTGRSVTLDDGEVYFEVVHDAKRPFTVYAGNRKITDLGTKFSVSRKDNDIQVVVKEGRVRLDVSNGMESAAPVVADGGKVVVTHDDETLLLAQKARDIDDKFSWRRGILIFNQETLAEIAAQFNRYNNKPIEVLGPAREIRIGGSFKMDNVAGFTGLLHRGFGLKVQDTGDRILISE